MSARKSEQVTRPRFQFGYFQFSWLVSSIVFVSFFPSSKLATFGARPQKLATFQAKLIQLVRGAVKNSFFGGFLPVFCPVSCFFTDNLYMTRIFFEKIGPSLFFLAAGVTETKVRRSTGVTTANSTNKYQKYKSVELGDQLVVVTQRLF